MNNITSLPPTTEFHNSVGVRDNSNGRWVRGPGRKPGSKNKQSELMKAMREAEERAGEWIKIAVDKGERWAIELVCKYRMSSTRTVEMESVEPATPADVLAALQDGSISVDEAAAWITTIAKAKGIDELNDHREQIAEALALIKQQSRK